MTDKTLLEVIGRQTVEITDLKDALADCNARLSRIVLRLVCVGGPLNDNVLGFNVEQRKYLKQILDEGERILDEGDGHD